MRLNPYFATLLALLLLATSALPMHAEDELQFNVPYLCNDGRTYVVHRCEKWPRFEACFYQTGTDSERYNTRQAVVYQMTKMCKLQGAATPAKTAAQPPSDLNDSRWDCGGGTAMTVIQCQKQAGQDYCFVRLEQDGKFLLQAPKPLSEIQQHVSSCKALPQFNPAYLAEFPNSYRVVQGMHVGQPRENILRAIGAFYQLSEIIKVFAGPRALTPDEKKFIDDYSRISSELAQAGAKAVPGQQFDPATNPYRYSRSDPKFGFEGIPVWTTFLSPAMQSQFARTVGGNDDRYAMAVDRERRSAMQQVQNDAKAQQAEASFAKDPGSVAARRCIESGRSEMECLGEGFKVGLNELTGGATAPAFTGPTGLRLSGAYSGSGGTNIQLNFGQSAVTVGCGPLDSMSLPYEVSRAGGQISVKVAISPQPLILAFRQDNSLAGPAVVNVNGLVVKGGGGGSSVSYQPQTQTTTRERQIDAAEASNYAGTDAVHRNGMEYSVTEQETTTSYQPVAHYQLPPMEPKTERCAVGTMQGKSSYGSVGQVLTAVLDPSGKKKEPVAPGLRLAGAYSGQGLRIEFRDDSATVECGEAHVAEPYLVHDAGGQVSVKIQNGAAPFTLTLQQNGALAGSGSIDVAGRIVTGHNGNEILYAPRSARCNLGTLTASK